MHRRREFKKDNQRQDSKATRLVQAPLLTLVHSLPNGRRAKYAPALVLHATQASNHLASPTLP